jgi:nucleotide-binding universal stress UspA family protein
MQLRHILAAADESDAGRQAVRTAVQLANLTSARLTVLRVRATEAPCRLVTAGVDAEPRDCRDNETAQRYLRLWLEADVLSPAQMRIVELATACGLPGIEICRFAERSQVDLMVLGRKPHSRMTRLLLGDTADAVARRSRVPCLFTPLRPGELRKVLVALDGSDRGINVMTESCDFARGAGATLATMTVEPQPADESLQIVPALPVARSSSLQRRVREVLAQKSMADAPLRIRRGDILERVIAEVQETGADALAVGYHRGGPPGVLEAGSTARRLAHVAPCSVLTIPL